MRCGTDALKAIAVAEAQGRKAIVIVADSGVRYVIDRERKAVASPKSHAERQRLAKQDTTPQSVGRRLTRGHAKFAVVQGKTQRPFKKQRFPDLPAENPVQEIRDVQGPAGIKKARVAIRADGQADMGARQPIDLQELLRNEKQLEVEVEAFLPLILNRPKS